MLKDQLKNLDRSCSIIEEVENQLDNISNELSLISASCRGNGGLSLELGRPTFLMRTRLGRKLDDFRR